MATASEAPPRLGRLLTADELAEAVGENRMSIYRWAREYGMPHVRFGRAMRFDPRAVAAWLDAGGTRAESDG